MILFVKVHHLEGSKINLRSVPDAATYWAMQGFVGQGLELELSLQDRAQHNRLLLA